MFQTASDAGISVEFFDFISPIQGIYICDEDMPPIIGLNRPLRHNLSLLRCVLAEELGHHYTSIGYCIPRKFYSYSDRTIVNRNEYQALKWAANYLIPEHDLLDVIGSGLYEPWELADHFNVTEEFAAFRLRLFGARKMI